MQVKLISHTAQPEQVVAAAAKLCYSDTGAMTLMEGLTEEKAGSFVEMLSNIGHESPIEHASFTFAVEGVSRSLLAQITRHRLASFSVQSQRYVKLTHFEYVTPPEIEAIVLEEVSAYLGGGADADSCVKHIQSRVSIWLAEHN